MYGWIIDIDHDPDGEPGSNGNAVGITGPSEVAEWIIEALKAGAAHGAEITGPHGKVATVGKFTMRDADNNLLYTGRTAATRWHEGEHFGPLDDFGGPNAGCVDIKYQGEPR